MDPNILNILVSQQQLNNAQQQFSNALINYLTNNRAQNSNATVISAPMQPLSYSPMSFSTFPALPAPGKQNLNDVVNALAQIQSPSREVSLQTISNQANMPDQLLEYNQTLIDNKRGSDNKKRLLSSESRDFPEDRSPTHVKQTKHRKPIHSVSEDSSEYESTKRNLRKPKKTKHQDESADELSTPRTRRGKQINTERTGWGDYPDNVPESDSSVVEPPSQETKSRKSKANSRAKPKEITTQSFSPQGTLVLGTCSGPRDNVMVEELTEKIFTGDWNRQILASNPNFTWQNAMFAFHRNNIRNHGKIMAKDVTRSGDLTKKVKLSVPVLVNIANAFVQSNPPYLICTDSKKALYQPTPAMMRLTVDDNWQYKEKSVQFDIRSVCVNEGNAEYEIVDPTGAVLYLTANMMFTHHEHAVEFREALSRYETKQQERKRKAESPAPGVPDPKIPRVESTDPQPVRQNTQQDAYYTAETDENGVPTQFVAELTKTGLDENEN